MKLINVLLPDLEATKVDQRDERYSKYLEYLELVNMVANLTEGLISGVEGLNKKLNGLKTELMSNTNHILTIGNIE